MLARKAEIENFRYISLIRLVLVGPKEKDRALGVDASLVKCLYPGT